MMIILNSGKERSWRYEMRLRLRSLEKVWDSIGEVVLFIW